MHRTLIVAETQPDAERQVARILAESDRIDPPRLGRMRFPYAGKPAIVTAVARTIKQMPPENFRTA